ncbi:hypothetical protein E2C01_033823 [Portunus trituberculatus]|uniref:Uncharacterized protein n=1 Tax=Portunus trituberculatus TaxID=210409 RepID=A0A5B7F3Z0_PORTR|nr:hypothetical protein [Portunus trituberculatus]
MPPKSCPKWCVAGDELGELRREIWRGSLTWPVGAVGGPFISEDVAAFMVPQTTPGCEDVMILPEDARLGVQVFRGASGEWRHAAGGATAHRSINST